MSDFNFDPKIKNIKPGPYESLSISLDYDEDPTATFAILLFTPDEQDLTNHFHITLTRKQSEVLKNWLIENL